MANNLLAHHGKFTVELCIMHGICICNIINILYRTIKHNGRLRNSKTKYKVFSINANTIADMHCWCDAMPLLKIWTILLSVICIEYMQ